MSQEFGFSVFISSNMMGNRQIKIIGGEITNPISPKNYTMGIREIFPSDSVDAESLLENVTHVSAEIFKKLLREILMRSDGKP